MRLLPILPAALCVAIGVAADPPCAWADSPVVLEGLDGDTREAILDLLPDRDTPESLFDAERIAEEAAARATVWLRSEGYYAATVTPEANENPVSARLLISTGPRFLFEPPQLVYDGDAPHATAAQAAAHAISGVHENAPRARRAYWKRKQTPSPHCRTLAMPMQSQARAASSSIMRPRASHRSFT